MRLRYTIGLLLILAIPLAVAAQSQLENPLGTNDLREVVGYIIKAALGLSGALALGVFVWGGFQWITSGGEKEKIEKGKRTIVWAVIGLFFVFISYTLVNTVIQVITTSATETTEETKK